MQLTQLVMTSAAMLWELRIDCVLRYAGLLANPSIGYTTAREAGSEIPRLEEVSRNVNGPTSEHRHIDTRDRTKSVTQLRRCTGKRPIQPTPSPVQA